MFQSYQFRQINPDVGSVAVSRPEYDRFNRINSGRSIPTLNHVWLRVQVATIVSIVSIQADQSRLLEIEVRIFLKNGFNRINSGRSIPTVSGTGTIDELYKSFNRINSGRSIPTAIISTIITFKVVKFQSYQFRQINPDISRFLRPLLGRKSFNRINSGRSIPTQIIIQSGNIV